jgi:type I restriction enzyme S subunit
VPESFETYQFVNKGDLIFRPTDLQNDTVSLRSSISEFDGIITNAYLNLRFKKKADSKFYHYFFRSIDNNKIIYGLGSGLRQNISYLDFRRFQFPFPPLQEQTAIAKFLDDKTAKIDQAIVIKQQQIDLLKQRRQILIHKAVTQGINPNVKLKDSGVEWIGMIAEHWEVTKLKNTGKLINGATPSSTILNFWDGDITWVTPSDINNVFIIDNSERLISKAGYKSCGTTMVPKGSLILTTRAPIGKIVIAGKELCTNQGCKSLVLNKDFISDYLYYQISICSDILNSLGTGTTFMELSNKALKNFLLVIPTKKEQIEISNYIENATDKIAKVISLKEQEIEKLKQYKSSLIDGVVTGKVKIN